MTEPIAPNSDDFEQRIRAHQEEWDAIIAEAEANAVVVRAQVNVKLKEHDAEMESRAAKADVNLQILRCLDPALAASMKGAVDLMGAMRQTAQPMPRIGQKEKPPK